MGDKRGTNDIGRWSGAKKAGTSFRNGPQLGTTGCPPQAKFLECYNVSKAVSCNVQATEAALET